MITFEGYDRRIKKIEAALSEYGIKGLEEAKQVCADKGVDPEAIVRGIMDANPDKVAAYRGGKKGLTGFFVGQAMKAMKGQGNPKLISQVVTQLLEG